MGTYFIMPATVSHYDKIKADSAEEALQMFTDTMDSDMRSYFQAVDTNPATAIHGYKHPEDDFQACMASIADTLHGDTESAYYDPDTTSGLKTDPVSMAKIKKLQDVYDTVKQDIPDHMKRMFCSILCRVTGPAPNGSAKEGHGMAERVLIGDHCDISTVEEILDKESLDYDWDAGCRLMCQREDLGDILETLEDNGIECDVL